MLLIENLCKKYNKNLILDDISLNIGKNKLIYIEGINGCGKTTLLKIIANIIKYDSGKITLDKDVKIGALIENPEFIESESLKYNLEFLYLLTNKKIPSDFDDDLKKVCDYFSLNLYDNEPVKKFSLGMKQKLGIIQAIIEKQNLILLDEPTRGLDKESAKKFTQLLYYLKNQGKTIIICAHDGVDDINFDERYTLSDGKLSKQE